MGKKNNKNSFSGLISVVFGVLFLSNMLGFVSNRYFSFMNFLPFIFVLIFVVNAFKKSTGKTTSAIKEKLQSYDNHPDYSHQSTTSCKKCGNEIASNTTYCMFCGTSTNEDVECEYCGHVNKPGTKRCGECQAALM